MNQKKVVVINESEANIEVLLELLNPSYEVIVRMTADRIIELVNDDKPDLILLGIMIPDIDGYNACKLLKSEKNTKDIPVIFMTEKIDEDSISFAYELGAADYVSKPFKQKELLIRIEKELKIQELILSLEESHKEVEILSLTDYMTKFYNRKYCYKRASEILKSSKIYQKTFSLMLIDIDNFKMINDIYGHGIGDDVILSFAQIIKKLSTKDDILCRWGGDEFLILLPDRDINQAHTFAEAICQDIKKLRIETIDREVVTYTVSIGVTEVDFTEDINTVEMIMNAGVALNIAKLTESNKVCDDKSTNFSYMI